MLLREPLGTFILPLGLRFVTGGSWCNFSICSIISGRPKFFCIGLFSSIPVVGGGVVVVGGESGVVVKRPCVVVVSLGLVCRGGGSCVGIL